MKATAMKGLEWRRLSGIDKFRLHHARLQAHHAAQWLARTARGYIPPRSEDSHTSLRWESALDRFITYPLYNDARLSLRITNLTLTLHDSDGMSRAEPFSLSGRSNQEVRRWLGDKFRSQDLDPSLLDAPSPYEMPAHSVAQGGKYDATTGADALAELAAWFANADVLLGHVQSKLIGRNLAASPACCWPHHFDIASLTMLPKQPADETGYIGIGLSPGDEYYDEPYFYISAYPKPDPTALPTLPMIGHWHTHEFVAAVLPAHRILETKDHESAAAEFLDSAVESVLKILS